MRTITKGPEPRSLVAHRANTNSNYGNYDEKDDLRVALTREQQGLCCYCMNRIKATREAMKIEHWRSQSGNRDLELSYSNLLGACLGGHGQPVDKQHCDTRKGNQDLKFNPANVEHQIEQQIRFEMNGTILSIDADFNGQINDVLNLNLPLLKNRRAAVLSTILDWWRREKARLRGPVPNERLARERARRMGNSTEQLNPFEPVAIWWLDQRLVRSAK